MGLIDKVRQRTAQQAADDEAKHNAYLMQGEKYWPKAERLYRLTAEERWGLDPVIEKVGTPIYWHRNSKAKQILTVEWIVKIPGLPEGMRLQYEEAFIPPSICLLVPKGRPGYPYLVKAKCLLDFLEGRRNG